MTLPLALSVPLMEDEPTTYFASRLAARNFQDARKLASDMAYRFVALERGCPKAIAQLAEVSGADYDRLLRNSPKNNGEYIDFGGQAINRKTRRISRLFICPACLQEDIAQGNLAPAHAIRGRIQWTLNAIGTCVDHGIALIPVVDEKLQHRRHDWSMLVAPILKDLPELTDRAMRRPASKLETYLVDRLKNGAGGCWLDRLPFFAAEQTAHLFGSAALFGQSAVRDLDDDQKYAAGDAGFDIVKDGPKSIPDFLSKLHADFVPTNKGFSPSLVYGRIHYRMAILANEPSFREVRDIIVEHAPSEFSLGPGDEMFGMPIAARQFHSVWSLSKQYGCSWKRTENILISAGHSLDRQRNGQEALFEAKQAEAAIERALQTISLKEGETLLGVSPNHMKILLTNGFVKRYRVDRGCLGLRFQTNELDAFLAKVMEGTEPVARLTPEMSNLSSATAQSRCKIGNIIQMILDKKLPWVGRDVRLAGVASLLVYPADVRSAFMLGRTSLEGMSAPDASRKLQIPVNTFRELANRKIVVGQEILEPLSGRIRQRFSIAELDRFDSEFVSLFNLSKDLRQKTTRLRRELDSKGIQPIPRMEINDTVFYRRADVGFIR